MNLIYSMQVVHKLQEFMTNLPKTYTQMERTATILQLYYSQITIITIGIDPHQLTKIKIY